MKTITSYYQSPIGPIEIICSEEIIKSIRSVKRIKKSDNNQLSKLLCKSLDDYFEGEITSLGKIPLSKYDFSQGTKFQQKVWRELFKIKSGIKTYGEIAKLIKSPKSSRAVGGAVGKNPFLLFLPCHRVLGSNKKITGFSSGIDKKKILLRHEGLEFIS